MHSITGISGRISLLVQNSDMEKCITMAASGNNFILEIFVNGCFPKTAANIYLFWRHVKEQWIFMDFPIFWALPFYPPSHTQLQPPTPTHKNAITRAIPFYPPSHTQSQPPTPIHTHSHPPIKMLLQGLYHFTHPSTHSHNHPHPSTPTHKNAINSHTNS